MRPQRPFGNTYCTSVEEAKKEIDTFFSKHPKSKLRFQVIEEIIYRIRRVPKDIRTIGEEGNKKEKGENMTKETLAEHQQQESYLYLQEPNKSTPCYRLNLTKPFGFSVSFDTTIYPHPSVSLHATKEELIALRDFLNSHFPSPFIHTKQGVSKIHKGNNTERAIDG